MSEGTDASENSTLRRVHGWTMVVAWLVLIPAGIFTARYLKDRLGAWWYRTHIVLQMTGVVLTYAAFGMALWFSDGHFSGPHAAHKTLGLIIIIGMVLQPILGDLADLMWSPARTATPFFPDKAHWILGYSLALLAALNCFLGIHAAAWSPGAYVAIAILLLLILAFFALAHFKLPRAGHNAAAKGVHSDPDDSASASASPSATATATSADTFESSSPRSSRSSATSASCSSSSSSSSSS